MDIPAVEGHKGVSIVPRGVRRGAVEIEALHFGHLFPQIPEVCGVGMVHIIRAKKE